MESIRSPHALRAAALLGAAMLLGPVACTGKDPYSPGSKLGTFHVSAKLTQSTCGEAPNPWEFDVRLNHDGSVLYWIQGGAPIQGSVDSAARTELKSETVHQVRAANLKANLAACSVSRADILAVTLVGSDAKPTTDPSLTTSFTGGLVYSFTPTEGSDCSDQLVQSGGGFPSLPCEVRYELVGAQTAAAP